VTARAIYLHEVVDIVGEGAMDYMAHVAGFDVDASAGRGLTLVGTWYTMGSTGRWPQVVNLWECVDGWAGWRRLMEATNLARTRNPSLEEWWRDALRVRTGGVDRLLGAVDGCPTLADLRARGVTGSVFVHELTQVAPGAARGYLGAVRDEWQTVLADYGHALVGLYEVLLTDSEVVTVWAADPASHELLMQAHDDGADPRLAAWVARRRALTVRWREELMTPHPATSLSRGDTL
jgi:hypothetical protein